MDNVLRAGLYERVSTQEQALHGYSIDTQKATLEEHCKEKGYKIVAHYTDEGISGAKPPLQRPALKQLLEDVQAGKIDIIIFTKLDRWFRSIEQYYKVQEILDKHNVPWQAVLEDYNTATADGRLKVNIMLSVAANERERTSERIKAVFTHKIKSREVIFATPPLGYKIIEIDGAKRMVKDPDTQDAIQEFWDMLVKENNQHKAGIYINSKYNLRLDDKKWRRIKTNEFYCGKYREIEDFCEPYVSREDWLKINTSRNIKQTKKDRVYLFTGLIRCPICGKILNSAVSVGNRGKEYNYYQCRFYYDKLCDFNSRLSEIRIEKWLLTYLEQRIEEEIQKVEIQKAEAKKKPKTDVTKLKEQLRKLNVMYMAGGKTDDEYLQETKVIKSLIDQASQDEPQEVRDLSPLKKLLNTDWKTLYQDMTQEEKRRFWRGIIKEIYIKGTEVTSIDLL